MIAFTQKFLRNKDDSKTNLLLQLGESCMPGIMDDITKTQESDQPEDKLCNLCEPTTNSDSKYIINLINTILFIIN